MPKLLDTRLVGLDISDVATRTYDAATPGQLLQVGPDGQSMVLGAGSEFSYLSRDAEAERSGISLQQYLCRVWHDITPTGANAFGAIYGIAYAKGVFYIVGADGTGPSANAKIVYSRVDSVTGSLYVETGFDVMATTPFNGPVYGVTYGDGKLLACGANGRIAVLGATGWEACNMPVGSEAYYIYRIAYGHRKGWVAVGTATSNSLGAGITLFSEDGITWRIGTPALGANVPIYGVSYGGAIGEEMFVAVGGVTGITTNHIAYSYDGINWSLSTTHSSRLLRAHYSVCFGNGRWLVGTQGPQPGGDATVSNLIASTTGFFEWESVPISNAISSSADANIQTISYGNGIFIAAGAPIYGSISGLESAILYQPPVAWTSSAGASCYGNGVFLVGSRNGKLVRSSVINEIGLGAPGAPGTPGPQGPQGAPGAPGAPGPAGIVLPQEAFTVGSYTTATLEFTGVPSGSVGIRIVPNATVAGTSLYVKLYNDFPYDTVGGTFQNGAPFPVTKSYLSGEWRNMGSTVVSGYYLDNIGEVPNLIYFEQTGIWQRVS